jgi:lipid-binding SYLF domain-containing protein
VVLLVTNEKGADRLLSTKFTLGGEGEVAGLALTGATLRPDLDDNKAMYGKPLSNKEIVEGRMAPPAAASKFMAELNKYSPREKT